MNQPTIKTSQFSNNAQKCYEFFSTKFTPELLHPNCPDRELYKAAAKECKEHFVNVLKLTPQAVNVYMGLCKDIMTGKLTVSTEEDQQPEEQVTPITLQIQISVYGEVTEEQLSKIRDSVVLVSPELITQVVGDYVDDFSVVVE